MRILFLGTFLFFSQTINSNPVIQSLADNEDYLYVNLKNLPIIDVNLSLKQGSVSDGDTPGLTNLMLNVLMNSDINDKKLISYFENVGAKLSYSVSNETLSISIRSISNLDQITMLSNVLNSAIFTDEIDDVGFKLQKDKILRAISESYKKPDSLLESVVSEKLFYDTPFSHQPVGTKDSVMSISKKDIKAHRDKIFNLDNLEINIVGDITPKDSKRMINKLTNEFSRNEVKPLEEYKLKTATHHTEFDSTQTHLAVIIPAVSRSDPDYYNLLVANYIFGGSGFGSWLMEEIRQKRGLSYSVYSYLSTYQDNGYLRISLQTKNESINLAKNIIREQVDKLSRFDVEDTKITATKKAILRSFEMRADTNRKILNLISSINYLNLDLNYFENYKNNLKQVNKDSIKAALNRAMDFDNVSVFTVGKSIE